MNVHAVNSIIWIKNEGLKYYIIKREEGEIAVHWLHMGIRVFGWSPWDSREAWNYFF